MKVELLAVFYSKICESFIAHDHAAGLELEYRKYFKTHIKLISNSNIEQFLFFFIDLLFYPNEKKTNAVEFDSIYSILSHISTLFVYSSVMVIEN